MSVELKDHISTCNTCCALGPKQPKETLVCHDVPDRPWAKIATDLFEFENKGYLRADFMKLIGSTTPGLLRVSGKLLSLSDQGPQFTSREFKEFVSGYGIRHIMTSPYHHQANGKVEGAVKQAKRILSKKTGADPYLALLTV